MSRPFKNLKESIENASNTIDAMSEQMKSLNVDDIQTAPIKEEDPQTKISKKAIDDLDAPKIRPSKTFAPIDKPRPEHDSLRKRAWEYVKVIAENKEVIGETIQSWYKPPISGEACHFWEVPVNTPVYIPRMLAEHLATRIYPRHKMVDRATRGLGHGEIMQVMVVEETLRRLDCRPVHSF